MSSVNRKRLLELVKRPENRTCADCDNPEPDWASYTIGIFLCNSCASIHRSLGSHISRIKSLTLDNWDRTQVSMMEEVGNVKGRLFYEKHLPVYYRKVRPSDPQVLKEQWIRAKYERKEFVNLSDSQAGYSKGFMEGWLWKRAKKDDKFQRRKFLLTQEEGTFVLMYYNKTAETKPKAVIRILQVNVTFSPEKVHPQGLHITYAKDNITRNIFVYSDDGQVIVDWYTAVRAAKLQSLMIAFPTTSPRELADHLTRDFSHEGYLHKTGPRVGDAYRRRYFLLDDRKLMYSNDPMDPHPKGEIFVGERSEGYSVKAGIPCGLKERGFGFMLLCPERTWLLGADTEQERDQWMRSLNEVMDRAPSPQDYAGLNPRNARRRSSDSHRRQQQESDSGVGSRNSRDSIGSTVSLTPGPRKGGRGFFSGLKD